MASTASRYTSHPPKCPETVGDRWHVVRPLAEGGMGQVYVARHSVTGRLSALKLLDSGSADQVSVERFRREAAVTAELGHPGIVDVLDAGEDETTGAFFIAMELLEGQTFADAMNNPSAHGAELLRIIDQALVPLAAAHEHGIVHRDIKPANIFVLARGGSSAHHGSMSIAPGTTSVKILDFGIARKGMQKGLTQTGTSVGTPYYMAPEQATNSRAASATADVWSVGVMIYEAFAQSLPFDGETAHAVIVAACTESHRPLREVATGVDPALSDLVDRCLCKDPAGRPPNAAALRSELAPFLVAPSSAPDFSSLPAEITHTGVYSRRPSLPPPRTTLGFGVATAGALVAGASAACLVGAAFASGIALSAWFSVPCLAGVSLTWLGISLLKAGPFALPQPTSIAPVSVRPTHSERPLTTAPRFGNEEPKVTLLAFLDLYSGRGRKAAQLVAQVQQRFRDDVAIVWRALPGPQSSAGAVAAALYESYAQGSEPGFQRLYESLCQAPGQLGGEALERYITNAGLNLTGFRHALRSRRHASTIAADAALAESLQVDGGPALFVNGQRFAGTFALDPLFDVIEAALGRERHGAVAVAATAVIDAGTRMDLVSALVQWSGARNAATGVHRSRQVAKKRAESILRRARVGDMDFHALAYRFSDRVVDLGSTHLSELQPSLRRGASALRVGHVSDLLETEEGFHILMRYG